MGNWIDTKTANEEIVISSRVRLARNLEYYLFPKTINKEDAREIVESVVATVAKENEGYSIFRLWENDKEAEYDIGKHLISKDILGIKDKSAYIKNRDETISIMINEEDHIKMQSIVDGLDLKNAFSIINQLDDQIEQNLNYAFDEEYGYLTSSLTNIGTGLRASVMIHLPALTMNKGITNILKGLNQVGMTIRGVYGDGSSSFGNIYLVSNQISLGVQESEIIGNIESIIENIMQEEERCREVLISKNKDGVEDRVFRAYGLLTSARLISYKECLDLLSAVRMGVEMGKIEVDKRKLNKLLTLISDEAIEKRGKDISTVKQIEKERAKLVQEILQM